MKLCEAPIDVLRQTVKDYQRSEHPVTGKMEADELVDYMKRHPRAKAMLPKVYKDNPEQTIPLSIVRQTILTN